MQAGTHACAQPRYNGLLRGCPGRPGPARESPPRGLRPPPHRVFAQPGCAKCQTHFVGGTNSSHEPRILFTIGAARAWGLTRSWETAVELSPGKLRRRSAPPRRTACAVRRARTGGRRRPGRGRGVLKGESETARQGRPRGRSAIRGSGPGGHTVAMSNLNDNRMENPSNSDRTYSTHAGGSGQRAARVMGSLSSPRSAGGASGGSQSRWSPYGLCSSPPTRRRTGSAVIARQPCVCQMIAPVPTVCGSTARRSGLYPATVHLLSAPLLACECIHRC